MPSTPFGTIDPVSTEPGAVPRRQAVRSGKRSEDTGAGCRANAAADLARAGAPGGDFMRMRLEQSAAVWNERAELLERLERNFARRKAGVAAA
jgi:hypothetical protein